MDTNIDGIYEGLFKSLKDLYIQNTYNSHTPITLGLTLLPKCYACYDIYYFALSENNT